MKYQFSTLENLTIKQKLILINSHKNNLKDSFFCIIDNETCLKIYEFITKNINYYNMVILYKNKPIGLFIGRLDTNISKFSVPIKLYVYTFRFIFQKIMKLEISDVGQFIFINILKNQKYKQYWIEIVFVDKAHRRFNLASIALDKYINKVPQNCEIWVDTRKHNQSALRFYTKNEFNIRYNIANILILKRQKI